jgi:hypothetical protein
MAPPVAAKQQAMVTNAAQLKRNVRRAMRKLLDKTLVSVSAHHHRRAGPWAGGRQWEGRSPAEGAHGRSFTVGSMVGNAPRELVPRLQQVHG